MTRLQTALVSPVLLACGVAIAAGQTAKTRAAADNTLAAAIEQVAALPGEPAIVSAAGVTRRDTELATLENAGAFDVSPKRRLVIVGGLDGDERSARAALDAVKWLKTKAPLPIRREWVASVLPLANPDHQPKPLAFPVDKGFYDDAAQPEARYVWRWTVFQAPDAVVVVTTDQNNSADALIGALRIGRWSSGLGPVPATAAGSDQLVPTLSLLLTSKASSRRSALHEAILARAARQPLAVARALASKYPQQAIASYIPSVAWTTMLRLSKLTGEAEWHDKVLETTQPWLSGEKKFLGEKTPLTSIAGGMVFAELARTDHNADAEHLASETAQLASELNEGDVYAHGSGWTDDMFMATAVLARTGHQDPATRMLKAYASRLQRPDGIFVHGPDAPHAWGRGNGFAALGLMEALTAMSSTDPERAALIDIVKRQAAALKANQAPDGTFREVIDDPGSYREETATAMLLTAMARGIRLGWLDRSYVPLVQRAWRALAAHVGDDGALVDVCASTGAGRTKRYYLDRPAINGFDDRGGAMALLASVEMHEFERGAALTTKTRKHSLLHR